LYADCKNLNNYNNKKLSLFAGDYSLDISHVTLDDDAEFECQVGAAPGATAIRSRKAFLTVLVPPDAPEILQVRFNKTCH